MRLLFLISLILTTSLDLSAQLVTSGNLSPLSLVQDVLLGSGVEVSNITYNGVPMAIGEFNGVNTNIGLPSGIIMTTGTIQDNGDGPHGPNNSDDSGIQNGAPGHPLLSQQIGGIQTYDASVLEFDFVPYSDIVRFNYVFGSEEYNEYVGSEFNDIFGFFISGPGIAGLQNIARLPNGQVVAINNVHDAVTNSYGSFGAQNAQFYTDNSGGSTIQYDGFTKVLTAESLVQCGQTYHLIIAIADAGDGILDSGIFLEANSLSSDTPVEISHTISQDLFNNPDIVAEGCVTATVVLTRSENELASSMTIPIQLSGTATNGVDYTGIPNSVTFPAGVQEVSFSLDVFQDGLAEGQESVIITLPVTNPCGDVEPIVTTIYIQDVPDVTVEIDGNSPDCPEEEVTLTAIPSGGLEPYSFLWNTNETTGSITVNPETTTTYTVQVTDFCLQQTVTTSFDVIIPVLSPLVLSETPDINEICPYIPTVLAANPAGGSGNYTYQWSSDFDIDLGNTATIEVTPPATTTYTVVVTDNCGNQASEDIVYVITSPPLVLTMSEPVEVCPNDSVLISVTAAGGYGQYYYEWPHSGDTSSSVWVTPMQTTTYTVIVSDECQTFTVSGDVTITVVLPTADFTITSGVVFNDLPIQFQNLSENAVTYEWDFGDLNTSTDIHPQNTYNDHGIYTVTLIAFDEKGCTDTIRKPIEVEEEWYIYVPNTFTPDGNRHNDDFHAKTIGIQTLSIGIFNRWGTSIFTSDELNFRWDGMYKGLSVTDGTYTYKIKFLTNSGRTRTITGHVNVLR